MSAAVGQFPDAEAPWRARTWTTFAGWRPAEALTVSTVVFHQTLSELLLFLARRAITETDEGAFGAAAGLKIGAADLDDLNRLNYASCYAAIPQIVGADSHGSMQKSDVNESLKKQGRSWALHVLEGPHSWCLSAAYIALTVIWGHPLFVSVAQLVYSTWTQKESTLPYQVKHVMMLLDAILYCFLPLFFSLLLRLVQRRELLARLGKRTLVIADLPYVHQLLESYISKLFSLSYSIASLDVHGANAMDHLVHRFTHRVYRGTLIAVGRTDGRLFSQSKGESWILMAMQQCKAIMHLGSGPEIISVGHNPYRNNNVLSNHITLNTVRPPFLCEKLSELDKLQTTEPMTLAAAVKELDRNTTSHASALSKFSQRDSALPMPGAMPSVQRAVGKHYLERLAPTELRSAQSSLQQMLERACSAMVFDEASRHGDLSRHELSYHSVHNLADRSRHGAGVFGEQSLHGIDTRFLNQTPLPQSPNPSHNVAAMQSDKNDDSIHSVMSLEMLVEAGPAALDRAIDQLHDGYLLQLFDKTAVLERWYEHRHASLERYIAFLVLFHQMASRVASFFPLNFNVARSQSQLRVATTAAPISAAEVQQKWATDFDSPIPSRHA